MRHIPAHQPHYVSQSVAPYSRYKTRRLGTSAYSASLKQTRRGGHGQRVIDLSIDAMIADLISWSERVGIIDKRPIPDTAVRTGTIATEAKNRVEQDRF